jgi:hypothetical protein
MLWYKTWLDTRWASLIFLVLLIGVCATTVVLNPYDSAEWLAKLQQSGGIFGAVSPEMRGTLASYEGYIWAKWFRNVLLLVWPCCAVTMGFALMVRDCGFGVSGLTPQFTLSLPITRRRLLVVGAATVILELTLAGLVIALSVPVLSRLVEQRYAVTDAIIYSALTMAGSLVFFSLAFLLTVIFNHWWPAMLIGEGVHFVLCLPYTGITPFPRWNLLYRFMSGERYFTSGEVPWTGLAVSVVFAVAIFYAAVRIFERRDF